MVRILDHTFSQSSIPPVLKLQLHKLNNFDKFIKCIEQGNKKRKLLECIVHNMSNKPTLQ